MIDLIAELGGSDPEHLQAIANSVFPVETCAPSLDVEWALQNIIPLDDFGLPWWFPKLENGAPLTGEERQRWFMLAIDAESLPGQPRTNLYEKDPPNPERQVELLSRLMHIKFGIDEALLPTRDQL